MATNVSILKFLFYDYKRITYFLRKGSVLLWEKYLVLKVWARFSRQGEMKVISENNLDTSENQMGISLIRTVGSNI